jgi:hypothetical protein
MPEVVGAYTAGNDIPKCQVLLDDLLTTLKDDFTKYKKRAPTFKLQETLISVAVQAGNKFTYSKVSAEYPGRDYKESLELLCLAGLAHRVFHTSARGIPLGAEINPRKFKVIPFDTGLHQRMLGLDISELITMDLGKLVNKGGLVEAFAGMEMIRNSPPHLHPQLYLSTSREIACMSTLVLAEIGGLKTILVELIFSDCPPNESPVDLQPKNTNRAIRDSTEIILQFFIVIDILTFLKLLCFSFPKPIC